jgi:hypothetical protein
MILITKEVFLDNLERLGADTETLKEARELFDSYGTEKANALTMILELSLKKRRAPEAIAFLKQHLKDNPAHRDNAMGLAFMEFHRKLLSEPAHQRTTTTRT